MIHHQPTAAFSTLHQTNQDAPIIDLATNRPIGYFSSEHVNTAARIGQTFFHANAIWKILHITDDETVFVLPRRNRNATPLERIAQFSRQEVGSSVAKHTSNSNHQLQTPASKQIIVETFRNYLIIHTGLGNPVNSTLRLAYDAMLTEQDLNRDAYSDADRILIQTPMKLTREELASISEDISNLGQRELEGFLQKAIASMVPLVRPEKSQAFRRSQAKKVLEEEIRSRLEVCQAMAISKKIAGGQIKIRSQFSQVRASSGAEELIKQRAEMISLELDALLRENANRFKNVIKSGTVELLCLECLLPRAPEEISKLEEKPRCKRCGSGLLAVIGTSDQSIRVLLGKKKSGKSLNRFEIERLAKARRTADLILSYGKKAILALTVTGIGPQTASSILTFMHTSTAEFYYDLLKAKIHYITTRELWERTRATNGSRRSR